MYIYIAGKRVFFEFFNTTERDRDILRLRRCKRKILELLEVYFRQIGIVKYYIMLI